MGFIMDHYEYLLFNHQRHFGPLFANPKKQYHLACLISHSFIPQVSYFKNPLTKTLIIDNMLVGQEIRDCLYHDTSQIWLPNRFLKRCFILFFSYVFFPSHLTRPYRKVDIVSVGSIPI